MTQHADVREGAVLWTSYMRSKCTSSSIGHNRGASALMNGRLASDSAHNLSPSKRSNVNAPHMTSFSCVDHCSLLPTMTQALVIRETCEETIIVNFGYPNGYCASSKRCPGAACCRFCGFAEAAINLSLIEKCALCALSCWAEVKKGLSIELGSPCPESRTLLRCF